MTKTSILIIGAGSQARIILDIFAANNKKDSIRGLIDLSDDGNLCGKTVDGIDVLGKLADIDMLNLGHTTSVIIGYGENTRREELFRDADKRGWQFASAVHPHASVSTSATVGRGSIISAGAVVCPGASIGDGVIINTGATVDHDCSIGNFAHICPGANLAGSVTVESRSWIGIGASVIQGITIGADCLIGAGAAVINDIPPGSTAHGVPATVKNTPPSSGNQPQSP